MSGSFCTSCGSCRIGTVDPYTGEVLVEVEIVAIPDDIVDPGPPEVSPGWLALAVLAGARVECVGPPELEARVRLLDSACVLAEVGQHDGASAILDELGYGKACRSVRLVPCSCKGEHWDCNGLGYEAVFGPVYRDECRPGHRCLGGCHEGERCRSEVEREQQLAVDGLGRFLRGLA